MPFGDDTSRAWYGLIDIVSKTFKKPGDPPIAMGPIVPSTHQELHYFSLLSIWSSPSGSLVVRVSRSVPTIGSSESAVRLVGGGGYDSDRGSTYPYVYTPFAVTATSGAGVISPDTWNHVCVTYDAATNLVSAFAGGELVSTISPGLATHPFGGGVPLCFGHTVWTRMTGPYSGTYADVPVAESIWSFLGGQCGGIAEFAFHEGVAIDAHSVRALASGLNPIRIPHSPSLYVPFRDVATSPGSNKNLPDLTPYCEDANNYSDTSQKVYPSPLFHPDVVPVRGAATVFSMTPPRSVRIQSNSLISVGSGVADAGKLAAVRAGASSSFVAIQSSSARRVAVAAASSSMTVTAYADPGPAWPVGASSGVLIASSSSLSRVSSVAASSSVIASQSCSSVSGRTKLASASSSVLVSSAIVMARASQTARVSAASVIHVRDGGDGKLAVVFVDAGTDIKITPSAAVEGVVNTFVFASSASKFRMRSVSAQTDADRMTEVWASTTLDVTAAPTLRVARSLPRSAATGIRVSQRGDATSIAVASASTAFAVSDSSSSGRVIAVDAVTSVSLSGPSWSNDLPHREGLSTVALTDAAAAIVEALGAKATVRLLSRADVTVALPGGATIAGGDSTSGPSVLLRDGVSPAPLHFAESPDGTVLMANGVDPMLAWDGLARQAWLAGLAAPAAPVVLSPSGSGAILGRFAAFQRFLDVRGNPSDLSPPGALVAVGRDGWIAGVASSPDGTITVRAADHGLSPGDKVWISGVPSPPIDGERTVGVATADTFTLADAVATAGAHHGGGVWSTGAASIAYDAPPPSDPKVARRQILRNIDGDMGTFYVDVDTDDLEATTFTSDRDDFILSTRDPVTLSDADGFPLASSHGVPPSHKAVLRAHQGRVFAAGEVAVTAGHAEVSLGSATVRGVGTAWVPALAGRLFYVPTAAGWFEIAAVASATELTLTRPYDGPSAVFAAYAIRPAPAERRLVYYSEPNRPESWPAWNAFAVPETNDEITGLVAIRSSLYVIERRHTHRFTFRDDPARDGMVFPKAGRGCVNQRCVVVADGVAYMLDESGVHAFDGDTSEHLSDPVRSLFQPDASSGLRIDWSADRVLWHGVLDQTRGVIRWFVTLAGRAPLGDAIAFAHRTGRWWVESYAEPVTSSGVGTVGHRRALAGTTARRVVVLGEGRLDAVADGPGATAGVVLSRSGGTRVELSGGGLPADLGGVPACVVSGAAAGQRRVICDSTDSSFDVVDPFDPPPAPGDRVQIGGVPFRWRSGWFRYAGDEAENPRDIEVVFQPTPTPQEVSARVYIDHADEPVAWSRSRDGDGLAVAAGSPDAVARLDTPRGLVIHRITGHSDPYASGDRYVSVELAGVQGASPVRVFQVTLSGCGQ